MKRAYTAATYDQRCKWDVVQRDGGRVQCMRRAVTNKLCMQHHKMREAFCHYCGGNDELPPDHTQDCSEDSP